MPLTACFPLRLSYCLDALPWCLLPLKLMQKTPRALKKAEAEAVTVTPRAAKPRSRWVVVPLSHTSNSNSDASPCTESVAPHQHMSSLRILSCAGQPRHRPRQSPRQHERGVARPKHPHIEAAAAVFDAALMLR
jgi:hypothetical protein